MEEQAVNFVRLFPFGLVGEYGIIAVIVECSVDEAVEVGFVKTLCLLFVLNPNNIILL
jgi:hypothetical protein